MNIFAKIEETLQYFYDKDDYTVQHEINEDIYTFKELDTALAAMCDISRTLYEWTIDNNFEVIFRNNFDEELYQILVKEI